MDKILRSWIVEILSQNERVIHIAVRQRAKFEGWLKFELAALAEQKGAKDVVIESGLTDAAPLQRADLSFKFNDIDYNIELKTPNTNWRIEGVHTKNRPITKNIDGIICDVYKLQLLPKQGVVAFVLFPIRMNSNQWLTYLSRISDATEIVLTQENHCCHHFIKLAQSYDIALVVGTFLVPRKVLSISVTNNDIVL